MGNDRQIDTEILEKIGYYGVVRDLAALNTVFTRLNHIGLIVNAELSEIHELIKNAKEIEVFQALSQKIEQKRDPTFFAKGQAPGSYEEVLKYLLQVLNFVEDINLTSGPHP